MTILITADLHLNNLPRDAYRHEFQEKFRSLAKLHKASTIMLLGDLTDEKDYHAGELVNKVVDHVSALTRIAPVVILKGNHDYASTTNTPFFTFLNRIPDVHWVGEPTSGSAVAWANGRMLFLPHTPNPERDWKNVDLKGRDWIFAHNTFEGTKGESGRLLTGPPTNMFPRGSRVISGDVHVPQTNGPVTYVGAPYHVDFGDSYAPRLLLIKNDKLVSIPCNGPQKQLVLCKAGTLPKPDFNRGDILKVRVELDTGQYAKWAEIKDAVLAWGAKYGYVIHMVQPITKQQTIAKTKRVNRTAPKSDEELLEAFAQRRTLDKHTTTIGLNILKHR